MKNISLSIFLGLSASSLFSLAQTCEEDRAQMIKMAHQECGPSHCIGTYCITYNPIRYERVVTPTNAGWELWCSYTQTDVGIPPNYWEGATFADDCPGPVPTPPPLVAGPSGSGGGAGSGGGGAGSGSSGGPRGGPPSSPPPCPTCCSPSGDGPGNAGPGSPGAAEKDGSIISVESQSVAEVVPVTGASFAMVYNSLYQNGRVGDFKVKLRVVGSTLRDYITSYGVQLKRGSSVVNSASFSNSVINQDYSYTWNGLDPSNTNPVDSATFVLNLSEISPAGTFIFPMTYILSHFDAKKIGLGGWMPSSLRYYDAQAKRLYSPAGSFREVTAQSYAPGQVYISSEDGTEVYIFDSSGKHLYTKTGFLGTTIKTFVYDTSGRLTSISEPFGKVTLFNRDFSGNFNEIVAPYGQSTAVSLDANGYINAITNPNSETYEFTYYGTGGLMQTFEKPNGEMSTFDFDTEGFLLKDTHSGGYFTELVKNIHSPYQYDFELESPMSRSTKIQTSVGSTGMSRTETRPNGAELSSRYEITGTNFIRTELGNGYTTELRSENDPRYGTMGKRTTQIQVTPVGGVSRDILFTNSVTLSSPTNPFSISAWSQVSELSGANAAITAAYNPSTKKFNYQTYLGKTSEYQIDSYERPIMHKTGSLNAVNLTYTNEHLTDISQGTNTTSFTYNTAGFLNTVTNALTQVTEYIYDNAGRISSIVLPDARVVGFSYDAAGNVIGITPPGRSTHIFGVNSSGLVGSYQPPTLSGVSVVNTTYSYNSDKQLTSVSRPDGSYLNFSYDAVTGVLQSVTDPLGTYSYDMDIDTNRPISVTTPANIQTEISYIGSFPSLYKNFINGVSVGLFEITLDIFGRKGTDKVTSGGGGSTSSSITYQYNDDEDLRKAGDINITYHVPNGYMTGTTMGSGTTGFTDTFSYNTNGQLTGYQAKRGTTVIYDLSLIRDVTGRVSGKTQTMNSVADSFVYTFDSAGRLTQTDKNSVTVATYSYDSNSNRNGGMIGSTPTTATYDNQDRALTFNTLSFAYNANGDLVSKTNSTTGQTTTYTYDTFGNLRQVNIPPSTVITYEIDGLNRRIGKKVNGVVQKRWVYMDQYRIAAELNASGAITKRFIYGSKFNAPDYMIASSVKYRIISDHLGSPRLVVKQSDGVVTQRMNHDEYGRVTEDTNPGYVPFGFAGGLYDADTGLVRFGARDYDPEVGRWTSKDPILFNGGDTNLFGYVQNDPVNWIDPKGEKGGAAMRSDFDTGGVYSEPKSCKGWRNLKAMKDALDGPTTIAGVTLPKGGAIFLSAFGYALDWSYNPTEEEKMQCGCMDEK